MKIKYKDKDGNLLYKCWNCKKEFNIKGMRYLTQDGECPECEKKIKI